MANVRVSSGAVRDLLGTGVTTTATGNTVYKDSPYSTFQAVVTGTGSVGATVVIEGSNNGSDWCKTVLGTITLTGTTSDSDGFSLTAPWKYVRARVSAISGTGARVTATIGI